MTRLSISYRGRVGRVSAQGEPRRSGFTLVELLVVIAILTILAGLVIGATMRIIGTMAEKDTQNEVSKLGVALNQQMQALSDQANKEPETNFTTNPTIMTMAGNDVQRARVIWIKLRLIQQFPESISDALNPGGGLISPDQYYTSALGAYSSGLPGVTPQNKAAMENSVCLALALSNSNRGSVFNLDNLSSREKAQIQGTSLFYIRDGWNNIVPTGNPVMFTKFQGWSNPDLNPTPPTGPNGVAGPPFLDPFDPAGKLSSQGWTNSSQAAAALGYPLSAGNSYNLQPFVFSTGGPANGPAVSQLPPSFWSGAGGMTSGWIYSYRSKIGGYN